MKEIYTTPNMEIVLFDCEDVITTSGLHAFSANEIYVVTTRDISAVDSTQWN